MEVNPIYKFMKDNGLTQKDEATFVSEYSNPQKSAELHKFMTENGLTTKDANQFYNEYFAGVKKKEGTQPASGQPVQQPGQPSAPSFGQKITEKIVNSAAGTQVPLKTTLQEEEQKKVEEKKAKIPTSKYFEVDVEEKQDETQAPKFADPLVAIQNSQKSKAVFNSVIGDKDIYKMPTPGESSEYASDITSGYLDYLELVGSSKSDTYKEKYKVLKAKSKEDRTDEDEKFLRQVESEAVGAFYDAKEWELGQVSNQIDELQKIAVTDEQKAQLNDLYGKYEKKRNSLLGTSSVYAQNKLQYGKIAGTEMADEEAKLRRFEALQAGDGKTVEFFKGVGGAVANGALSIAQVPKVFGDLIGDTDYDWADEMYDMVSGQKADLDREFGTPLPKGKSMSSLPLTARLAVVGGNAIGSAGLFAAGGGLIGATSNLGKAAATFGTAFLTSEADYYQEALDAGMSPQQAALAGTYLAAQTALVESIIPDIKYFEPSAFRKSVIQGLSSGVRSGLPVKEAAKLALKNTIKAAPESVLAYGKTGVKEAGEELLGQVGEDVGKEMLNAAGKRQYFNDTFNPESYTDAILGGFIAGGGMSVFSRPTSKSPTQQEVMREIVDRKDLLTGAGTDSDKIGDKEDLRDFNEATEIFDAMSSHSVWKDMPREKQNQAFALAQQAAIMKKEQERMKKLRIPDEQKDAEIKRLEDEVNMMFAEQLEQQKQRIYDQENIQGIPGQVGVGQELVQGQPIQGAGQEATTAGGVLQAQEEVDPKKVAVEKAQKQLEGVNSRINPNAKHPFFNVGQKHDDGNKYIVKNAEDNRTDTTKDGVEVITKILSPAEVDENGKMTKAAEVEIGIFDSNEQAQEYVNSQYNKYKAMAEEKLAKANAELSASEGKPTTGAAPAPNNKIEGRNDNGTIYKSTTKEKDGVVITNYRAEKDGKKSTIGGRRLTKEQFLSEYEVDEDTLEILDGVEGIDISEIRDNKGKLGISARFKFDGNWGEFDIAASERKPTTEAAPTRISEINNLEQALFENEVQQNETGAGTLSEQQVADITARLDKMRGQNKEGGLNEIETLMKQALGENLITAADIDRMVEEGSVEIKCPPKAKAQKGMRMGFIPGGKWDIVTEFKGKSHENGGIDIEITGGKINYTSKEPNLKAKKGGFWKAIKDVGLGIIDTQLSTIGNVAGIKSMQDIIDEDQYSNDKFDEAGNFVGKLAGTALKVIPVTAPIASAVGAAGGIVNQVAGIDQRFYDPSKHTSKLSQAGDIISAVGSVVGMAVGGATSAGASKALAAGDKLTAAQQMSVNMSGINKALGQASKGMGMFGMGGMQQQPQQFLQQTQSNPAFLPQQTIASPYQQYQYGMPVQQTYSNSRSNVVTINGVNYAPDQYGNLIPLT